MQTTKSTSRSPRWAIAAAFTVLVVSAAELYAVCSAGARAACNSYCYDAGYMCTLYACDDTGAWCDCTNDLSFPGCS